MSISRSPLQELNGSSSPAPTAWRRVIVFRCCRLPQFEAALAQVRQLSPDAEVWALSHERFADEMRAAGADHVITHRASRFTLTRLGVRLLHQLRAVRADAVVLPLMDGGLPAASNLFRLAVAVGSAETVIRPGDGEMIRLDQLGIRGLALSTTFKCPESTLVLWQMALAWARGRRDARPRQAGERRRVLHIINSLGIGGAQTQFTELLNRTPAERYSVDVLVLSADGSFARSRLARHDVRIRVLDAKTPGTPIEAIARVCREGAYDIVHTWLPQANMYGSAAARLAGVPRIITSVRSLNPGWYPQWRQWWYRPADVLAARIADVVTVNARPLARDHGRWALWPAGRIQVVHNGLDVPTAPPDSRGWLRQELGVPADTVVIGSVGRLAIEKDYDTFIRAVAAVREGGRPVHALLAGDGPCDAALRARVTELGLTGQVSLLGARRDIARIMAGLDLFVLTSTIEGFPNVLLEAALLGVPVVASDVGGVPDLVVDPEARFPSRNPAAAARTIERALADRAATVERAARMQARCCREFTADRMVQRWLALYDGRDTPRPVLLRTPGRQPEPTEWCGIEKGKET